jgi:hypothetical protein
MRSRGMIDKVERKMGNASGLRNQWRNGYEVP